MLSKVCEISEPERVFTGGGWAYRPRRAPGDPEGVALHTHIVASLSCGHRVVYELTLQQLVYVRCPTCAALAARLLSIGESLGGAHHATLEDGVLCLMRESRGVRTAVYLFPYAYHASMQTTAVKRLAIRRAFGARGT